MSTAVTIETVKVFLGHLLLFDVFGALFHVLVEGIGKNVMSGIDWTFDALSLIPFQVQMIPTILFGTGMLELSAEALLVIVIGVTTRPIDGWLRTTSRR